MAAFALTPEHKAEAARQLAKIPSPPDDWPGYLPLRAPYAAAVAKLAQQRAEAEQAAKGAPTADRGAA